MNNNNNNNNNVNIIRCWQPDQSRELQAENEDRNGDWGGNEKTTFCQIQPATEQIQPATEQIQPATDPDPL